MNREIIFRGKAVGNNNVWVYGDLEYRRWSGECYIHRYDSKGNYILPVKVIPATIGQYTGLKDKNGTMIFEGDIIQGEKGYRHVVGYDKFDARFVAINLPKYHFENYGGITQKWIDEYGKEVIGNIHDNNNIETK